MTAGFVVVTFFDNWVSRAAHSFHNHQLFEGKKEEKRDRKKITFIKKGSNRSSF